MGCSASKSSAHQTGVAPSAAVRQGQELSIKPFEYYIQFETIFEALERKVAGLHPVRLLRGSWLLNRAAMIEAADTPAGKAALALPRRQDLEQQHPEAFISVEEVKRLPLSKRGCPGSSQNLPVGAVSYAWKTPGHPDPDGAQIVSLAKIIRRAQKLELPGQNLEGKDPDRRFPSEFGIFLDWASLPQKDESGFRTDLEKAAFNDALSWMQLWYAHQKLFGIALSKPLPGGAPSYDARGWPTFEKACMVLAKQNSLYSWPSILDSGNDSGELRRSAPIHPDALEALLGEKRFTSPKADKPMVSRLYRETVLSTLGGATELKFLDLGWGIEDIRQLIAVLPLMTSANRLNLNFNQQIGREGIQLLARTLANDVTLLPAMENIIWPQKPSIVTQKELSAWCGGRIFQHSC